MKGLVTWNIRCKTYDSWYVTCLVLRQCLFCRFRLQVETSSVAIQSFTPLTQVHLDPANKDALHAARRVREATQKLQAETKSRPMTETLGLLGKIEDQSHKEREQTWKTLIGLVSEDSNVALALLRQGGLSLVWPKLEPTRTGEANEVGYR